MSLDRRLVSEAVRPIESSIRMEGEHHLLAHLPSSQRADFMRLRVGDRMRVAISAQDRTRGRALALLTKGQVL